MSRRWMAEAGKKELLYTGSRDRWGWVPLIEGVGNGRTLESCREGPTLSLTKQSLCGRGRRTPLRVGKDRAGVR